MDMQSPTPEAPAPAMLSDVVDRLRNIGNEYAGQDSATAHDAADLFAAQAQTIAALTGEVERLKAEVQEVDAERVELFLALLQLDGLLDFSAPVDDAGLTFESTGRINEAFADARKALRIYAALSPSPAAQEAETQAGASSHDDRHASHPICPACGCDQHDDWWHALSTEGMPRGKLECGCGVEFSITMYSPGSITSSVRAAGLPTDKGEASNG